VFINRAAAAEREAKGGDEAAVVKPIIYEQDRGTSEARSGSLALDIMVGKHVAVRILIHYLNVFFVSNIVVLTV
jgi:hypothetical protein